MLEMDNYDKRKDFLETIKILNKTEQEELFRILKRNLSIYTENSNGIFFDVTKLNDATFEQMIQFVEFCKKNRQEFQHREEEEKKAQDCLKGLNDY
jgi:hypothetical protein